MTGGIARGARRVSPAMVLLSLAVVVTALTGLFGSLLMWNLFQAAPDVTRQPLRVSTAMRPLVVGIGRTPGGPNEWVGYARVLARLQRDLDRRVVLRYALDRGTVRQLVTSGDVDIAFVTVPDYVRLADAGAATLIAAPVVDHLTTATVVAVVAAGGGIDSLEDLKGGSLLVARESLGGQFVRWLFSRRGQDPEAFFGSVTTTGTQDENLQRVASGAASATCVSRTDLAAWPRDTFRVVAQSPQYGTPPVVAKMGLDPALAGRIGGSLLSAAGSGALSADSSLDGFVAVSDRDYDSVRELLRFDSPPQPASEGVPR